MLFNKKTKQLDVLDLALTKFSVAFAVVFLLVIWPAAMNCINSISPWYFLVIALLAAARPVYRFFK